MHICESIHCREWAAYTDATPGMVCPGCARPLVMVEGYAWEVYKANARLEGKDIEIRTVPRDMPESELIDTLYVPGKPKAEPLSIRLDRLPSRILDASLVLAVGSVLLVAWAACIVVGGVERPRGGA